MLTIELYYTEEGRPKVCPFCGSLKLETVDHSYMEHILMEYGVRCVECGQYVGYWAHGYFDPIYIDTYQMLPSASHFSGVGITVGGCWRKELSFGDGYARPGMN